MTLGVPKPRASVSSLALAHLGRSSFSLSLFHPPLSPTVNLQSTVTFDLTLDPGRLSSRAIFQETGTRNLTRVRELGLKQHCEAVRLLLPVRSPGEGGDPEAGRGWWLGRDAGMCSGPRLGSTPKRQVESRRGLTQVS